MSADSEIRSSSSKGLLRTPAFRVSGLWFRDRPGFAFGLARNKRLHKQVVHVRNLSTGILTHSIDIRGQRSCAACQGLGPIRVWDYFISCLQLARGGHLSSGKSCRIRCLDADGAAHTGDVNWQGKPHTASPERLRMTASASRKQKTCLRSEYVCAKLRAEAENGEKALS